MNIKTHKDERGFTLIETCIAMVMLLIVVCGVLPLGVYALKYNSAAAIRAGAVTAAQRKLEQLRADSFTSCVSSSEVVTVGPTDSQTYTVEVTVTDVTTTLKNIRITVTPQGRSTSGGVYAGNDGWMRGQVVLYTKRTTSSTGSNLG
ncbi:MAG TPA: prepilin-type N-terminal cleavage/methylation domain-containing protein [Pyrinomonadaceae bacterium]|nr:prepilin-type N-terminal cleavage/methylation domain-containing protein [Pyrinomonadaceae bacterium]